MKIFDFTAGKKGELLANVGYAHSLDGWLVRKGDRVFKVSLAAKPKKGSTWEWHSGAQTKSGTPISPEQFGVEAICFCTGAARMNAVEVWRWNVIGTADWNREACKKGILKYEFSHTMTSADRARNAAADALVMSKVTDAELGWLASDFDCTVEEIRAAMADLEAEQESSSC